MEARPTWQARRDLNPQPPDLESDALPLELLASSRFRVPGLGFRLVAGRHQRETRNSKLETAYFASLWGVCFRHHRQNFFSSTLSGVFCLFLVDE